MSRKCPFLCFQDNKVVSKHLSCHTGKVIWSQTPNLGKHLCCQKTRMSLHFLICLATANSQPSPKWLLKIQFFLYFPDTWGSEFKSGLSPNHLLCHPLGGQSNLLGKYLKTKHQSLTHLRTYHLFSPHPWEVPLPLLSSLRYLPLFPLPGHLSQPGTDLGEKFCLHPEHRSPLK